MGLQISKIFFSIVVPLYNKERYIKKTLKSILSQSFTNFEIVVVNDGSTDGSVVEVLSCDDDRIVLVNQKNGGVSQARNKGIGCSKGQWIIFFDADDILESGTLEEFYRLTENFRSATIVSGNFVTVYPNGKKVYACHNVSRTLLDNPSKLLWQGTWNMRLGSFAVKRELLSDIFFPEYMCKGEDVFFVNKLLAKSMIAYSPIITMCYERVNSSLSNKVFSLQQSLSWNLSFDCDNLYLNFVNARIVVYGVLIYLVKMKSISKAVKLFFKQRKAFLIYFYSWIFKVLKLCRT